jgi:hypothetical protein
MQFKVAKYSDGDDCEFIDDPNLQPVFRARRATPPAQPAPVQQKPLFADIIAKHPGLAEELKAMDAAPVQEPSLLATLKAVQGTLIAANEQGQIADTIWFSAYETLFDFIDAEIDKAEQATPPAQPAVPLTRVQCLHLEVHPRMTIEQVVRVVEAAHGITSAPEKGGEL